MIYRLDDLARDAFFFFFSPDIYVCTDLEKSLKWWSVAKITWKKLEPGV